MKENTRNRTSVAITGIDTSTPDNTVADGKCAELHNARYAAGAWRNVCNIPVKHSAEGGNYRIVYHHPAAGDNVYIVYERGTTMIDGMQANRYSLSTITFDENDGSITEKTEIYSYASRLGVMGDTLPFNISHFGNVLIIGNTLSKYNVCLLLASGVYKQVNIGRKNLSVTINNEYQMPYTTDADFGEFSYSGESLQIKRAGFKLYNYDTGSVELLKYKNGYWRGEIALFVAIRDASGAILYRSPLRIVTSYRKYENEPYGDPAARLLLAERNLVADETLRGTRAWIVTRDYNIEEDSWITESPFPDITRLRLALYIPQAQYIRPTLELTLSDVDDDIANDVAVYCTRLNDVWDYDKMDNYRSLSGDQDRNIIGSGFFYTVFADNNLPEQPFYLAKSVCLKDFKDGKASVVLDEGTLKDIETNGLIYTPVIDSRTINSQTKEYNGRVHFFDTTTHLPNVDLPMNDIDGSNPPETGDVYNIVSSAVRCKKNNDMYVSLGEIDHHSAFDCGLVIDYPDVNATDVQLMTLNATDGYVKIFPLRQALANGLAYYTAQVSAEYPITYPAGKKYHTIQACIFNNDEDEEETINNNPTRLYSTLDAVVKDRSSYSEPNKLMVSVQNNPFNIDFANSYAIGSESNRILAVNSAAIEMSDAKFGEMPLYVFTEEGIFAMQSESSGVLYSATIPINYDRIINVQTLAVNYNLLYITERGVHALSSQGSTLLSEPLNGADNIPSRTFLSRAQMYHYKPYNEVLIYEPPQDNVIPSPGAKDKGAYVYSLDAGYWSSRDFVGQRLNNDEAYLRESTGSGGYVHTIYDLASREGSAPLNMRISSRPIKFGAMEFKRLETFIQRLSAYPGVTVSFVFSGSNDLVNRTELRRLSLDDVVRDITLRRFPFSCRYLYVDMEIDFKQQESAYMQIGAIDMEYYFRFLHRLR